MTQTRRENSSEKGRRMPGALGRLQAAWYLLRDPQTPVLAKFGVLLAGLGGLLFMVGYGVSPLDLLPDVLPPLTWIDDLFMVPLVLWLLSLFMPRTTAARLLEKFRRGRGAGATRDG